MTSQISRRVAAGLVAASVLALLISVGTGSPRQTKHLSADFANAVSLYQDATVKVLGVPVGHVTHVQVVGTHVHVDLDYDANVKLPAEVQAVIVPPSVAGDRFIQLAPAYVSGTVLPDNTNIPEERTAVPQELDQTYQAIDDLSKALGPSGANRSGALNRLLVATDRALAGNARSFNATIGQTSSMLDVLAAHRDDFTGTISNLNAITGTLAADDPQIRALATNLALVASDLAGQRQDIATATTTLNSALADVADFLDQNGSSLNSALGGVVRTTSVLAQHSKDLSELLDVAPLAATNLFDVGQPQNFAEANAASVAPAARDGAIAARADFFQDLSTQLGYALSGICRSLPTQQQQGLAPLCGALATAGGDLGSVLSGLLGSPQLPLSQGAPALSLNQLLSGGLK